MREILFRGKRQDNGAWVEGAFCQKDSDDPFGEMLDRPSIIKYDPPCDGFWYRVIPETVGQYTGLTDKNGKKIFEGDILTAGFAPMVVVYDTESCQFQLEYMHKGVKWENSLNGSNRLNVIGNIHDNPELLET